MELFWHVSYGCVVAILLNFNVGLYSFFFTFLFLLSIIHYNLVPNIIIEIFCHQVSPTFRKAFSWCALCQNYCETISHLCESKQDSEFISWRTVWREWFC